MASKFKFSAKKPGGKNVKVTVENDFDSEESLSETEEDSDALESSQAAFAKRRKKVEVVGPAGHANVIKDILSKNLPVNSCPVALSAKSDKERFGVGADEYTELKELRKRLVSRKRWLSVGNNKPTVEDREPERELQRIACRGVVQLFNTVREHQKLVDDKLAGRTESHRQKALSSLSKADFLDRLAGRKPSNKAAPAAEKPGWKVLSDDYLTDKGVSLKNWDNQDSDSDQSDVHMDSEESSS